MSFAKQFILSLYQGSQREPRSTQKPVANRLRQRASAFVLESLETRVMMSATPMEVMQATTDHTAAIVTTDKPDYAPGETAIITTSNTNGDGLQFSEAEMVRFQVTRTDGIPDYSSGSGSVAPAGNEAWYVIDGVGGFTAQQQFDANGQAIDRDANGVADWIAPDNDRTVNASISTSWFVEDQYLGSSLLLTATGQDSGAMATTAFTDAVDTTTTIATNDSTTTYGSSVTFTATVTAAAGVDAPTGSVEFFDGATSLGAVSITDSTGGTTSTWSITIASLNAGTHASISAIYTATGDFNGSASENLTQTVSQATATITVTPYNVIYNGAARTATGTAVGILGESLSGLDLSATTHTNAGTYNDTWTFTDVTGNYQNAGGTVSNTIEKATARITVNRYIVTYDGAAHSATGTATGVGGVNLSGLNLSGTTHTNVGTYIDTCTFTDVTGNYKNATKKSYDYITKAAATITVNRYNLVYDGAAHTATGTAVGVKGESLSGLNLSGTTHTNAGSYIDSCTFTDVTGNYKNATKTSYDYITKATATVTVSGYTGAYDGAAHGATGTATGVGGVNLSAGLNLGAKFTNVPGGTATWTFIGGANYKDKTGSVAIVIT